MILRALPLVIVALVVQGSTTSAQVRSRPGAPDSPSDSAALRQALDSLTREMVRLRLQIADDQIESMRKFNANVARLNILQADLDRFRKEQGDQQQKLRDAEARQEDFRYKIASIQQQLAFSPELDRTNAENRLRESFTRQLNDAVTDANDAQLRLGILDQRIERAERLVQTLHQRLKIDDSQIDVVDEPASPPSPPPPSDAP